MEKKRETLLCPFKEVCPVWSSGCTSDYATASNCGFIAGDKKRVEEWAAKKIQEENGKISFISPEFLVFKDTVKYLTDAEFYKVVNDAYDAYVAPKKPTEPFKKRAEKSPYFA
ncbi:MAG: hypothetical protein WC461_02015 [Candidatus Paceibacterota bacterium]